MLQEALGCEHRQPTSIDTHAGKDNPSNPGGCGEGKSLGCVGQALCPLDVVACCAVSCSFMVVGADGAAGGGDGGGGGVAVLASDRPASLRRAGVVGQACDADLPRAGRRVGSALAAVRARAVPTSFFAGLGDDVALASAWSLLDTWVDRVAEAFERADTGGAPVAGGGGGAGGRACGVIGPALPASNGAPVVVADAASGIAGEGPTWVDALSDAEAETVALRLATTLRPVPDPLRATSGHGCAPTCGRGAPPSRTLARRGAGSARIAVPGLRVSPAAHARRPGGRHPAPPPRRLRPCPPHGRGRRGLRRRAPRRRPRACWSTATSAMR